MPHPAMEVADIFRTHGAAWRAAHAGHISLGQLKVMSAIEACRTAALGGHIEACEDCGQVRIAYNSLYGDFSVKSLVRVSASFSLSLSTACTQTNRGTVDRKVEAGVNPDQEQGEQCEGSLPRGAQHRAATLYSVGSARDPDHEAVNGFSSKAPRRRAHSVDGIGAMELFGSPPPRIATPGVAATVDPSRNNPVACSDRRP
jgi:hypothetical protein